MFEYCSSVRKGMGGGSLSIFILTAFHIHAVPHHDTTYE